jgi:hypothetical protein
MALDLSMGAEGFSELVKAVSEAPQRIRDEVGKFLVRGIAVYNRIIYRSPWQVGGGAGGAPVASRNLLGAHLKQFNPWNARIYIDDHVKYAQYVHDGTKNMSARPWLDYAAQAGQEDVDRLSVDLLDNILNRLT